MGGEGIAEYVASKPADLKADFALVSDTELFAPGLPTLCVGLRGMIYTEIEVRGAKTDLHSGMYGGAAPNPFFSLAHIIAKLKDENGRILIPGFYDDVVPPERRRARRLAQPSLRRGGVPQGRSRFKATGRRGRLQRARAHLGAALRSMSTEFPAALSAPAPKTVIPAKATAKVSMRLVPDQTPAKAFALYKSYVEKIAPAGVDVDVRLIHSGDPCLIPVDNPYIRAATRALHEVWGKDTVFIRSGGSIPIVGDFDSPPRPAQRHDGLRPARRQSPRSQREVQPEELRAGHRIADPLSGGSGAVRIGTSGLRTVGERAKERGSSGDRAIQ